MRERQYDTAVVGRLILGVMEWRDVDFACARVDSVGGNPDGGSKQQMTAAVHRYTTNKQRYMGYTGGKQVWQHFEDTRSTVW